MPNDKEKRMIDPNFPPPPPPYFDRDRELAIEMLKMAMDLLTRPQIMPFNKED